MPLTPGQKMIRDDQVARQEAVIHRDAATYRAQEADRLALPPGAQPTHDPAKEERAYRAWKSGREETRSLARRRQEERQDAVAYERAFSAYLRRGLNKMTVDQRTILETRSARLTGEEIRDLGVATGGVGGFLVPASFGDKVAEAQKWVGGVRLGARIFKTATGAPAPFPLNDDSANVGELITEGTVATSQDTAFTSRQMGAFLYSSKTVKAGWALVQDAAFDLESWLAGILGVRIARAQNPHLTTGTGAGQPLGIMTGITVGKTGTAGQVATLIWDDLVDLIHSVDAAYRIPTPLTPDMVTEFRGAPRPAFMMADATYKFIEKMKDTATRPLFPADAPMTLLGYPVIINNDMAPLGASNKSVAFGAIDQYVIRQKSDVSVLVLSERYADSFQTGYLAFSRADGALLNQGAVAAYQHPAS